MKSILPDWLYFEIVNKFNMRNIQEIRIRLNQPIKITYKGEIIDLNNNEISKQKIIADQNLIDTIINLATRQSLYAYENQIRDGYIVSFSGIRIGVCGTAVCNDNKICMLKNITSLNIRIGHEIENCSDKIINYLIDEKCIYNSLIISPPGAGKTTLVRDIIRKFSNDYQVNNILVVDEKMEIAGENLTYSLGENVDVIQSSNKNYAFKNGIKYMNPNVIVTDEIISQDDVDGLIFAMMSGVKIIATVHAENLDELKNKIIVNKMVGEKVFDRFVVLSKRNGVGTIEGVYNKDYRQIM